MIYGREKYEGDEFSHGSVVTDTTGIKTDNNGPITDY